MSIVNEVRARVRCEVYPCKNRAVAAIGPENRRQICFNVCEDHLRQIIEDGAALLTGEALADAKNGVGKIGDTTKSDTALLSNETGSDGPILDDGNKTPQKEPTDSQNAPTDGENNPDESPKPTLVCKHCGEPFEKKTDLMSHAKVCPNRPPKES